MPKVPEVVVPPMLRPRTDDDPKTKPKATKMQTSPPAKKPSANGNGKSKQKPTPSKPSSSKPPHPDPNGKAKPVDSLPKDKARKQLAKGKIERNELYPAIAVKVAVGAKALNAQLAKELLGLAVSPKGVKEQTLVVAGERVYLTNNNTNRPVYKAVVDMLCQEILHKRWGFNGEPIIIGKTGLVLNGQHRLLAIIEAHAYWADKQGQFKDLWPSEPTIDSLVVFGVSEDDAIVNTLDTGRSRSLLDVMFRSDHFKDLPDNGRRICSRIAAHAIANLWYRTGAAESSGVDYRTHAESLAFVDRHPKLLACVRHIFEENGDEKRLQGFLNLGTAASLTYLMGSAATDRDGSDKDGYAYAHPPDESYLDWGLFEKAQEFWVLLAGGNVGLQPIRAAIAELQNQGGASSAERTAVVVKAWNLFSQGKKVTDKALELDYLTPEDDDAAPQLGELPLCGGIDMGRPNDKG